MKNATKTKNMLGNVRQVLAEKTANYGGMLGKIDVRQNQCLTRKKEKNLVSLYIVVYYNIYINYYMYVRQLGSTFVIMLFVYVYTTCQHA